MKKSIFLVKRWMIIPVLLLALACNDDKEPATPNLTVVEEDFAANAAYEDVDFVTLDVVQSSGFGLRTNKTTKVCESMTINHDLNGKKITIDFGAGCTGAGGVVRKGKIILTYSSTYLLIPGTTIVTTFDGYEVNGYKVEGSRTLTNAGVDMATSTLTLQVKVENGKVTWPDATFVTYSSNQVRKVMLKETGYEVSITGTATGKSRENISYTAAVSEALVLKQECVVTGVTIPTTGIMELVLQGFTVTADYGTGTCDKIIGITYPGGTKDITVD